MSDHTERPRPLRRSRERISPVRLGDVADLAEVSTATVSRAFNEPEKVSESVRQRVFEAAARLNWIPNAAGRALASSRTHIAGAIIPTLDSEIFARQVSAMQTVLAEGNFTLFLGCSNYDPAEGFNQAHAMVARGVEALSIVGEDHPPELFELLDQRRIPHVITYSYRPDWPHPCVGFDHGKAFRTIAEHLLSRGHRRFGAIFQPIENNRRVEARLDGVRKALAEANVRLDEDKLFVGAGSMDFGAESFARLMDGDAAARPTAIICGNDVIALGALGAAKDLGLAAPDDFSITGFDDLTMSSKVTPKLTTMRIDNARIGHLAAQKLLTLIGNPGAQVGSIELFPELRVRESTGPAPS